MTFGMEFGVWSTFFAASLLLAVAPGPDNLFVLVQSASLGARAGLWVVLGLLGGIVLQTFAAALGIAAVVAASPMLFWGIRILGAAYLIYLAVMAWRAGEASGSGVYQTTSGLALWRRGFVMNVTNPKVQIFFLAFFPQFVAPGSDTWQTAAQMVVMGVTFGIATAVVFALVAVFAGRLADRLRTPRVQFFMNRVSAVIFVLLAAGTLLSS